MLNFILYLSSHQVHLHYTTITSFCIRKNIFSPSVFFIAFGPIQSTHSKDFSASFSADEMFLYATLAALLNTCRPEAMELAPSV